MTSLRSVLAVLLLAGLSFGGQYARAEQSVDEAGGEPLVFKLPRGVARNYAWKIVSEQTSKGLEKSKPINVTSKKTIAMKVLLRGGAPKRKHDRLAILRFQDLKMEEDRQAGETKTRLTVERGKIFSSENGRVLIDSLNDIGLEQITDYQRQMRDLARGELRVELDATGKPARTPGRADLMKTLHGGNAQSIFPLLPKRKVKLKDTWNNRFELRTLGDLKLDEPASVRTRARLAQWQNRGGRRVALIEIVSAWETRNLAGHEKNGLAVNIADLNGYGSGVCVFDPVAGCFLDGWLTFTMAYRMDGSRGGEQTRLDVKGKTHTTFKLLPGGPAGAKP